MKGKTHNRLSAVFMALVMMLTCISFNMFASAAATEEPAAAVESVTTEQPAATEEQPAATEEQPAATEKQPAAAATAAEPVAGSSGDKTYVLDTTLDLTAFAQGSKSDGASETAGTEKYFTLYYSTNTKVDANSKSFEDGYSGTQRVNFGGSANASTPKNVISFKTDAAATVKVWWVEGTSSSNPSEYREITILGSNGSAVATTTAHVEKGTRCISTLELSDAGTYYLGSTPKNNYIFKVEVTEHIPKTYVLDTTLDLTAFAQGSKSDGASETAGTEKYFTLYYSTNTKVDANSKSFEDGYSGTQRVNFGGSANATTPKNVISFKTGGAATVKVWWVEGTSSSNPSEYREITILGSNGSAVATTTAHVEKGTRCISTLKLSDAGTYYLGSTPKNNYIFKVEVTEGGSSAPVVREDWANVAAPVIKSAKQTAGKDEIVVSVDAVVGAKGGDAVNVTMLDKDGKEVATKRSIAEKNSHEIKFEGIKASGTYTFKAVLVREKETDKPAAPVTAEFVLTLKAPAISSVTSMGGGKISVVWGKVDEAEGYEIYRDGTKVGDATETNFTDTGLTVGTKYSYTVAAVRGEEIGPKSDEMGTTATAEEQQVWSFVRFGDSTNDTNNGFEGAANDGKVTVYSEGGKGKVQPGSSDGLAFYYTELPTDKNFKFRAKAHLENWVVNNGQEGFGLLAMDSVPDPSNGAAAFWTNQYMAVVSKMEYYWDSEFNEVTDDITLGTKYTMNLGVGVNSKLGVNDETLPKILAKDKNTINQVCGTQYTLETSATGYDAGTYNIADTGEQTAKGTTISKLTDFVLEIQKNNTGYFISYYDENGNLIGQKKFYDPNALSVMNKDSVYVGFFAARNMRASFSDIKITLTDPKTDPPAEKEPTTTVRPNLSFKSASIANSTDYELRVYPNIDGKANITVNGTTVLSNVDLKGKDRADIMLKLTDGTSNKISVSFTANGSDTPVVKDLTVKIENKFADLKTIYVAPNGTSNGNGSPDNPLDIQTAVNVVRPGQTIVVKEGTYNMTGAVTIERGIDGTSDKLIRMIADPSATTRPVFDFQKQKGGFAHGGDYWYMRGFDICNAGDGSAGIRVYGHNNTLDQVNAYGNGKTGISISTKESGTDKKEIDWPSNNLVLNCTSHNNADVGYEDADGFEAKLTCGEGNVFDGCIAYNNADDGWDLYARLSSGPIGAVTIKNCVAYGNGYLEDGTNAGNGNGFKLGGDGIAVKHKIINSVAFNNKADGITSNSNPDVIVENCTSYNNEKSNINLYGKGDNTDFEVKGFIGFKDSNVKSGLTTAENFKPAGSQAADKYQSENNYYWNGSESANSKNATVSADVFKSLKFDGSVARNDDGTINLNGFLELSDKAPKNSGAVFNSKASDDVGDITPDDKYPDIPSTPDNPGSSSGAVGTVTNPSTSDKDDVEFEHSDTNIKVTAPAGAFEKPDEIKFNVVPVVEETKDNQFTFDLTFTDKDGNKVQPKTAVTVKIPVPEALKGKTIYVYHVENDGKYTEISCKVEDGMVVFSATSFSKYIITSEKLTASEPTTSDTSGESKPTDSSASGSGSTGDGNSNNPSTGAAVPFTSAAVVIVGAAVTIFITKRKRG